VLEDLVLYVVLAVAIGYAGGPGSATFGLPGVLGISAGSGADLAYHVSATLVFLAALLIAGPPVYRVIGRTHEVSVAPRSTPIARQLTFMLAIVSVGLLLGVEAFFGAFVAGIVVAASEPEPSDATVAIRGFSLAFFIPVYFATIGLGLDLANSFDPVFFAGMLLFACSVKAASVYLGARLAGESARRGWNLAVAMNARGGPGIVVASTAFAAGIIDRSFYSMLVMLAVVTSLVAGAWLVRVPRAEFDERSAGHPPAEAIDSPGLRGETGTR
jgi:Kef-type K+ transport system membrane component KefB